MNVDRENRMLMERFKQTHPRAWAKIQGMPREELERLYIALVIAVVDATCQEDANE